MPKITPLEPPERTGSAVSQQVVRAMRAWLSVCMDGENWGHTVIGCEDDLAEALDALIASRP